jgi:hypothetical protein
MTDRSDLPQHLVSVQIPRAVRKWYRIHRSEGVHRDLAMRRAVERACCAGEISEHRADRLEAMLNSGPENPSQVSQS